VLSYSRLLGFAAGNSQRLSPPKALPPSQRQQIGLQALAGTQSITALADEFDVSRKFVSRQVSLADRALADAFDPKPADDEVLFYLPVTKRWLCQLVLALVLTCRSSTRSSPSWRTGFTTP